MKPETPRRLFLKSSVFGVLAAGLPNVQYAREGLFSASGTLTDPEVSPRYPAIAEPVVKELVGASHFNLDRVKEIVGPRPELARATWDWGFGDWETALGAASHVGRRDIAEFLMSHGARPDIFTFAMLGALDAVEAMIESRPGTQTITGPHGISLLSHARVGLRPEELTAEQVSRQKALIAYLEGLGDADPAISQQPLTEAEKDKYLGDYRYGEGPDDGFTISLNMRKMLSLGKLGGFGGGLYHLGGNAFSYNGLPSVTIQFLEEDGAIRSLTVEEPGLRLTAVKA